MIARLFTTGVTPMMLDDLASGFNIAQQITFDPHFNALCGFARADVDDERHFITLPAPRDAGGGGHDRVPLAARAGGVEGDS